MFFIGHLTDIAVEDTVTDMIEEDMMTGGVDMTEEDTGTVMKEIDMMIVDGMIEEMIIDPVTDVDLHHPGGAHDHLAVDLAPQGKDLGLDLQEMIEVDLDLDQGKVVHPPINGAVLNLALVMKRRKNILILGQFLNHLNGNNIPEVTAHQRMVKMQVKRMSEGKSVPQPSCNMYDLPYMWCKYQIFDYIKIIQWHFPFIHKPQNL